MGSRHYRGTERRGTQHRGALYSKYLPCLLLLIGGMDLGQTEKDKKTTKVGFRGHLRYRWKHNQGREGTCPRSHTEKADGSLCVAFLPTSELETLPNLELGPVFFRSFDSILKILPWVPFFLTVKARLLGMNYSACSGLAPATSPSASCTKLLPPGFCTCCVLCLGRVSSFFTLVALWASPPQHFSPLQFSSGCVLRNK